MQPLIFDIRRFALDDGPGIRTTVFFKGCPLACLWCHNPEAIRPEAGLFFQRDRCVGCGECAKACPDDAICLDGSARVNRQRCTLCGACADACPATALKMVGRYYPPAELVRLLLRDLPFFSVSGGGVTFSGGEPTLHSDYLQEILAALRSHGIHTALQTCGHFDLEPFRTRLLPLLDLIFFDLKLADPGRHRRFTGQDNTRIRDNFRRLAAEAGSRLVPRVPLVPEITATEENLQQIAALLNESGFDSCDLLPYHPGGLSKRQAMGEIPSPLVPDAMISQGEERQWRHFMQQRLAC